MPFPPPTHGHVEDPIGESLIDYLVPKPAATRAVTLDRPFELLHLEQGDVVIVEQGRNPHQNCHALVELDGDVFLCQLHYRLENKTWYARRDGPYRRVPENMLIQGIVRHSVKDQLR